MSHPQSAESRPHVISFGGPLIVGGISLTGNFDSLSELLTFFLRGKAAFGDRDLPFAIGISSQTHFPNSKWDPNNDVWEMIFFVETMI